MENTDRQVGVINAEGPPVPIPNTEVKLCRAENTWLEAAREDRYSPTRTTEVRIRSDLSLFLAVVFFTTSNDYSAMLEIHVSEFRVHVQLNVNNGILYHMYIPP